MYQCICMLGVLGNLLLDVGPSTDGQIPLIAEERLRQLGTWLRINGEAIYETVPWIVQQDPLNTMTW